MVTHYKYLHISNYCDIYRKSSLQLRPDFDPQSALNVPTRTTTHVFILYLFQLQNMQPGGTIGSHGKDLFMTFDQERYRAYVAPLNLTKQKEDELLCELWKIAEALVDQSLSSPTYPLQLAIACEAFDALEQAIELESNEKQKTKEELCL